MNYDFKQVEKKWQDRWEETGVFHAKNEYNRPKFYCLVEFPYPSGQGLHVGHPRSYTALDIVARKKRLQGYNVLYPMGWDAFGLPTENYAIKNHIHPEIVTYQGGDLPLKKAGSLKVKDFPFLERYIGQELIVTDGTTLLGADDKAGVAEIVTACEHLLAHPEIRHRAVAVCFTPDEEVGKGADHFDPEKFPARVAYTVDGGELGEIEYENFNAAAVTLTVEGVNIHPGSAKNKMKNAILLANQFISLLPAAEAPAHTEGYEGFYHVTDLAGNESQVVLHAIIRDHDLEKFNARKAFVERLTAYLNDQWGQGTFRLEMRDSYYNMKEKIRPHMELIENAKTAMEAVGVEPVIVPIRGGTDGARLSWEQDIPCPNLCTGGANFHGVHEFIPVPSMEKMVQVLVELVKA